MISPNGLPDPEEAGVKKSHLGFPVVGIGASAGGVAALQRLFGDMPSKTGMAFVVVIHLSPKHESLLTSILQRSTSMLVVAVVKSTPIEADHVYVISPSMDLTMSDGQLCVGKLSRPRTHHTAIDLFFRTLGQAHQERSIALVLSGTGSDGTQGLKRMKEQGGVTIAQSPDDAEYDQMPKSAIATGLIDFVLPVVEMPQKLLELWANAQALELPSPPADMSVLPTAPDRQDVDEEALKSIQAFLLVRTGHDFSHYKRATVLRRLERRLQVNAVPNLAAYRERLESDPKEPAALLQDMLISVTNFFRDREAFEALERTLATVAPLPEGQPYRAWVAGCATGEEAYSVTMLLAEMMDARAQGASPVQVFASDIDQRAIEVARKGVYPESIVTDVAPTRLRLHFLQEPHGFRVQQRIRDSVLFSIHNVLSDPAFGRLDLICCRNLLIYLDREAQAQVLRTFAFALKPDGLLFLGSSETADADTGLFTLVDKKYRIYRIYRAATSSRPSPSMRLLPAALPVFRVPPAPMRALASPLQALHEQVLASNAAPTVLIDADHTVLHVDERAAHLLRYAGGAPSTQLVDLLRPELRVEVRTALFKAETTGRSVQARRVRLTINGQPHYLGISVKPVRDNVTGGLMLITLDESELTLESSGEDGDSDPDEGAVAGADMDANGNREQAFREQPGDQVVAMLEAELARARHQLTHRAGEAAISTEELRASNEELQAMNEELRSATEELETSREELQSINEELTTVNHELQSNNEETGKVNDDLRNLIASTGIGSVFVDRALRVKRFTPKAAELFSLIDIDLGRSLLDLTHRLEYPELSGDLDQLFRSLSVMEREVRSQDGHWFLVRLQPYRTSEDRIDGAVLSFIDVSERRRAVEGLRRSEERLQMVADSMHDYAIITLDSQGLITSWNVGARQLFGYTSDEVVGRSGELIFTEEDRLRGVPAEEMGTAAAKGRASDDRWHLRKDGSTVFCSGVMAPLMDGQLLGYAKIARDLTQVRLMETQRQAVLESEILVRTQLQEAAAQKDEFLAVMSHELKNPLNLIQLNAELLLRSPRVRDDPSVVRAAGTIRNAVVSQAQIIDDLLDMSRLNTGKLVLAMSQLDLNEVAERIVGAIQPDAAKKQQTVVISLEEAVVVMADPVRVEQILWNLITNAFKFTPAGGTVTVSTSQDSGFARLDVTDTGIGLQPQHLKVVFEMFQQVQTGTARARGGLGIGLALVKRLVELQGGRVEATSPGLNQGSTFSVWLPLARASALSPTVPVQSKGLDGLRILVIDDEVHTLSAFGELLTMEGSAVTLVGGADEALKRANDAEFDLVLSDLAMPGHDGYWLISHLRAQERTRQWTVIALSGMGRSADREKAVSAGFNAHLSKPLQLETLLQAIERLRVTT